MNINELALQVAIIFLPGIIARIVTGKLIFYKQNSVGYFLLHSFVLGFVCYACYWLLVTVINYFSSLGLNIYFVDYVNSKGCSLHYGEIASVSFLSIIVGAICATAINKKALTRVGQLLGITTQFSEPDVWSYVLNSNPNGHWVVIRDIMDDLMYEGWIRAFSDTFLENELFLTNVKVYKNSSGQFLYDVPGLYLTRDSSSLTIEFTSLGNQNGGVEND